MPPKKARKHYTKEDATLPRGVFVRCFLKEWNKESDFTLPDVALDFKWEPPHGFRVTPPPSSADEVRKLFEELKKNAQDLFGVNTINVEDLFCSSWTTHKHDDGPSFSALQSMQADVVGVGPLAALDPQHHHVVFALTGRKPTVNGSSIQLFRTALVDGGIAGYDGLLNSFTNISASEVKEAGGALGGLACAPAFASDRGYTVSVKGLSFSALHSRCADPRPANLTTTQWVESEAKKLNDALEVLNDARKVSGESAQCNEKQVFFTGQQLAELFGELGLDANDGDDETRFVPELVAGSAPTDLKAGALAGKKFFWCASMESTEPPDCFGWVYDGYDCAPGNHFSLVLRKNTLKDNSGNTLKDSSGNDVKVLVKSSKDVRVFWNRKDDVLRSLFSLELPSATTRAVAPAGAVTSSLVANAPMQLKFYCFLMRATAELSEEDRPFDDDGFVQACFAGTLQLLEWAVVAKPGQFTSKIRDATETLKSQRFEWSEFVGAVLRDLSKALDPPEWFLCALTQSFAHLETPPGARRRPHAATITLEDDKPGMQKEFDLSRRTARNKECRLARVKAYNGGSVILRSEPVPRFVAHEITKILSNAEGLNQLHDAHITRSHTSVLNFAIEVPVRPSATRTAATLFVLPPDASRQASMIAGKAHKVKVTVEILHPSVKPLVFYNDSQSTTRISLSPGYQCLQKFLIGNGLKPVGSDFISSQPVILVAATESRMHEEAHDAVCTILDAAGISYSERNWLEASSGHTAQM